MPAQKGNQYAKGNKGGGRDTLYQDGFADLAYKYCLLGATDKELGDFFGVTEATINNWKKDHEEFFLALKKGKDQADAEVASRLHERALGFEWFEEQPIKLKETYWEDGKKHEREVIQTVLVKKQTPPDPTSSIFWLKNRQPDKWRDKQIQELTGKDGGPIDIVESPRESIARKLSSLSKREAKKQDT